MKKTLLLILAAALCLSLCACGAVENEKENKPLDTNPAGDTDEPAGKDTEEKPDADTAQSGDTDEGETPAKTPVTVAAKPGVLQKLAGGDDLTVTGVIAISPSYGLIEDNIPKGFKTEGINSEFKLGENIEFYFTTDVETPMLNVYFVKDDGASDYASMTAKELEDLSVGGIWGVCPDSESFGYVGSVCMDSEAGIYDAFVVSNDVPMYLMQFNVIE